MKSITVTTHRAINYGAVLQSYALHKTQKDLGIDNYLLDIPKRKTLYSSVPLKISKRTLIVLATNLKWLFHSKEMKTLVRRFNNFVDNNINRTEVYGNLHDLALNPPVADFYINGSDQVFGLRGEFDKMRMLEFGPDSMKRYSFAASLGEYDWNAKEKEQFSSLLEKFSKISVREEYAKQYLESFSNVQCEVHMDPVFLLGKEDWSNLAADRIVEEKYILCYPLVGNDDIQKVLDELKAKTGYKIVSVQTIPIKRVKADRYILDAGPKEFLSLIKNAEYVVTTSFHGTAFSIIFEKPFYTLVKNYKSQRMTDLLKLVSMSDRLYSEGVKVSTDDIDFSICRSTIASQQRSSLDYLTRVIEDATYC